MSSVLSITEMFTNPQHTSYQKKTTNIENLLKLLYLFPFFPSLPSCTYSLQV